MRLRFPSGWGATAGTIVFLAALTRPTALPAQVASPTPRVLGIPGSVRSAGLQGAGVALVGDAGAVFSNPAGLATLRYIGLEGTYRRVPGNLFAATGAAAFRLRQFDLGLGVKYLGYDSASGFPRITLSLPHEALAVGSLIYRYGLIALGGSVRYLRRNDGIVRERALSGDLGLAIAFFDIMAIGFAVQNITDNWYHDSPLALPRVTRLGFTMNYVDPLETFRLLSVIEGQWPEDGPGRVILGAEAGIVVYGIGLIGRAAYSSRPQGSTQPRLTAGGSVALGRIHLDYAYAVQDPLGGAAHRVGLRLTL